VTEGVDANKRAIALAAGGTGGSGRSGSAVAMVRGGEGATFSALLILFIYSTLGFDPGESILVVAGVLSFPGRSVSHLVLIPVMNNLASRVCQNHVRLGRLSQPSRRGGPQARQILPRAGRRCTHGLCI